MQWLQDRYVVLASDVLLYDTGRGWNWRTRAWETVSGTEMQRSIHTHYRLRAVQVRVYTSAGAGMRGRLGQLYIVGDPQATDRLIRLEGGNDLQGGNNYISWQGDYPMLAGFEWRFSKGGLAADEIVVAKVGYE